jgi:hypothetical protein
MLEKGAEVNSNVDAPKGAVHQFPFVGAQHRCALSRLFRARQFHVKSILRKDFGHGLRLRPNEMARQVLREERIALSSGDSLLGVLPVCVLRT